MSTRKMVSAVSVICLLPECIAFSAPKLAAKPVLPPQKTEAKTSVRALTPASNRMAKRFGAYVSVLGDPSPTLVGINGAYNITDYLRATAGLGYVSTSLTMGSSVSEASLTTFGGGIKAMMPGWNLTPIMGLNVAYAAFSSKSTQPKKIPGSYTESVAGANDPELEVNGLKESQINPYLTVGADWQDKSGFNAGLGIQLSFIGADATPYFQLGWFF